MSLLSATHPSGAIAERVRQHGESGGRLAPEALFGVGAGALLLLFVGIHNSWDAIAYHVLVSRPGRE